MLVGVIFHRKLSFVRLLTLASFFQFAGLHNGYALIRQSAPPLPGQSLSQLAHWSLRLQHSFDPARVSRTLRGVQSAFLGFALRTESSIRNVPAALSARLAGLSIHRSSLRYDPTANRTRVNGPGAESVRFPILKDRRESFRNQGRGVWDAFGSGPEPAVIVFAFALRAFFEAPFAPGRLDGLTRREQAFKAYQAVVRSGGANADELKDERSTFRNSAAESRG